MSLPIVLLPVTLACASLLAFALLCFRAARAFTRPKRVPCTSTPAVFGLPYETVLLRCRDREVLSAWYLAPTNGATIILVHGHGANKERMLERARDLAGHGFGALLLDLRGHGDSLDGNCSAGYHEVEDIAAAVAYLRNHPAHASPRIGILGESLGGAAALLATPWLPEISAVAVDSTFSALDDVIAERFQSYVGLPAWLRPFVVALAQWQVGVNTAQVRPVEAVPCIGARALLIMHGEDDQFMPVHHARQLHAASDGSAELWIVPGARHAQLYGTIPDQYTARLVDFFTRHLLENRPTSPGTRDTTLETGCV